jgi:hypothetical protein
VAEERSGDALAPLTRAVEIEPDRYRAWRDLGRAASAAGDFDRALVPLRRALEGGSVDPRRVRLDSGGDPPFGDARFEPLLEEYEPGPDEPGD